MFALLQYWLAVSSQGGLSIHDMQVDQEERCFVLDILHDLVIQVRMQILVPFFFFFFVSTLCDVAA